MPAQTLDAFLRSLAKGDPAPAYYFHGPEDLLKDESLRALLDRVLDPALRDFNLDQRGAAQLDADALFGLCTTLPMMAERRVVVLREVEALKRKPKVRAALLDYLGRPAPDTVLVLRNVFPSGESDSHTTASWWPSACVGAAPGLGIGTVVTAGGVSGTAVSGAGGGAGGGAAAVSWEGSVGTAGLGSPETGTAGSGDTVSAPGEGPGAGSVADGAGEAVGTGC